MDEIFHQRQCQLDRQKSISDHLAIVRMILRLLCRLKIDGGKFDEDLCENIPLTVRRRQWNDFLSHRDELCQSDRHWKSHQGYL